MTHQLQILDVGGAWFVPLQRVRGENVEHIAVALPRRMKDARTLTFAMWGDFHPYTSISRPYLEAALANPVTIDDVIPTPPAFLDWWRRVCSGELARGVLAGEGSGGDPLEHQADEERPKPRKRIGERVDKYEKDEEGRYIRLELGAPPMTPEEEADVYTRGVRMGCLLGVVASVAAALAVTFFAWLVDGRP